MATILENHNFKSAFVESRQNGFTLVLKSFAMDDIRPWEVVTRKYDEQHYCVIIFESRPHAEMELGIFPPQAGYRIQEIAIADMRKYVSIMNPVCGDALLVFLRDKDGRFAMLNSLS